MFVVITLQVLDANDAVNTIKLSFSVKVNDHHLLENASTHWVGLGSVAGEEMLWVGQDAVTILKVTRVSEHDTLENVSHIENT